MNIFSPPSPKATRKLFKSDVTTYQLNSYTAREFKSVSYLKVVCYRTVLYNSAKQAYARLREEYYVSDIGRNYLSGHMKEGMSVVVSFGL